MPTPTHTSTVIYPYSIIIVVIDVVIIPAAALQAKAAASQGKAGASQAKAAGQHIAEASAMEFVKGYNAKPYHDFFKECFDRLCFAMCVVYTVYGSMTDYNYIIQLLYIYYMYYICYI